MFRSEAINACATGSQWPLAIHLVALPPADVIAVAGALSACEHGSYWAGAIHLLQSMPQSRLLADEACNQSVTCQKMLAMVPNTWVEDGSLGHLASGEEGYAKGLFML